MKKTMACLALLLTATLSHAAEQKIIFNAESVRYKSGTDNCQEICGRKSDPPAESFMKDGWKIISSGQKEIIGSEYWYTPCSTCEPHGCTCIGTQYVLQKDDPAPLPKVETSNKEVELLKKENDLLKQEISLLKQENKKLKSKPKSKKK